MADQGAPPEPPASPPPPAPAPAPVPPLEIVTPATEADAVREKARTAWTFGILAISLAMTGMCFSYVPFLLAIPIALVAMNQARTALGAAAIDEAGKVYGRTAQILSTIALSFSIFVVVLIALFVLLYVMMFASMFGLMLAVPPPPAPMPGTP
jgi:hypothetical protein